MTIDSIQANAEIFLRLQLFMYEQIKSGKLPKNVNIMQRVMDTEAGMKPGAMKFLLPDESFVVGEVECGQHGHLGPNGNFGNHSWAGGIPVRAVAQGRTAGSRGDTGSACWATRQT